MAGKYVGSPLEAWDKYTQELGKDGSPKFKAPWKKGILASNPHGEPDKKVLLLDEEGQKLWAAREQWLAKKSPKVDPDAE